MASAARSPACRRASTRRVSLRAATVEKPKNAAARGSSERSRKYATSLTLKLPTGSPQVLLPDADESLDRGIDRWGEEHEGNLRARPSRRADDGSHRHRGGDVGRARHAQ